MAEDTVLDHSQGPSEAALLATYAEICRSYHAIDEFRMKLLGLLPLASLIAVFILDTNTIGDLQGSPLGADLLRFGALFAALLTLALFGYEIRGIVRSHNLIIEGQYLEELLGIGHGQFHVCAEEHGSSAHVTRELFVMRNDGSEVRQLTHSDANNTDPSWSPNGEYGSSSTMPLIHPGEPPTARAPDFGPLTTILDSWRHP